MTHIGFVTIVEDAPATIDDQKLTTNVLSISSQLDPSQHMWNYIPLFLEKYSLDLL
jgi:hypothetical protein